MLSNNYLNTFDTKNFYLACICISSKKKIKKIYKVDVFTFLICQTLLFYQPLYSSR